MPSMSLYFLFPSDTWMEVRDVQPENAPFPMEVTLEGMDTEVRDVQPEKASLSM